ncbi:MAG: NUDIX domain-containing protein [Candidatus Aenigmatarchaeota archaeon]
MIQSIVVAGVLIKNDKVLLLKRKDDEEIYPGEWELPSGKVKFKEDPNKALIREFKEETNLNIKIIRPVNIHHFFVEKENRHAIQINYLVRLIGKENIKLSDHSEFLWLPLNKLNSFKTFSDIKKAIKLSKEKIK